VGPSTSQNVPYSYNSNPSYGFPNNNNSDTSIQSVQVESRKRLPHTIAKRHSDDLNLLISRVRNDSSAEDTHGEAYAGSSNPVLNNRKGGLNKATGASAGSGHQRSSSYGSEFLPDNRNTNEATKQDFLYNFPSAKSSSTGAGTPDSLYENAYLVLDPELQPISPATDIPESMQIFEEHKRLAQEYLQTQTEIACLMQAKDDLEKQLVEHAKDQFGERASQRFCEQRELESENISLVEYHKNLKRQLEIMKGKKVMRKTPPSSPPPDYEPEPGWVLVRPKT
jgi:mitogen-activated protein kinase kinase kinase 7